MSDYIAIIRIVGGGSWSRNKDKDKAVKAVCRQFKEDWSSLYKLPKGRDVKVAVADVDGHDEVYFDDRGVWATTADGEVPITKIEMVEAKLP